MRTRIIAAFPGTGKTYYHNHSGKMTLDVDTSSFMKYGKAFPDNFIEYIKDNIEHHIYEFIFVSTHKEIIEALLDNCIFFYLIYPSPFRDEAKEYYLKRYKERGDPESFIRLINKSWEKWLRRCWFTEYGCKNIKMVFPTLEDELQHIIASEHGDVKEKEDETDNG